MRIHAALMTQNELLDLSENVRQVLPHVDTFTIVDGGSIDGTIPYVRAWAQQEPKLRFYIHPWQDNFPAQRNNYLRHVAEVAELGDWLLTFDPDEFIELESLTMLREYAAYAAQHGYGRVGLRCDSVTLRGPHRVHVNVDDYWKQFLIRWAPSVRYTHDGGGTVHERLEGLLGPDFNPGQIGVPFDELRYEHRKQDNIIWWRGARNYFCGGGGPNLHAKNPFWVELRTWCAEKLGIPFEPGSKAGWQPFLQYLIAGNIDPWLKNWMIVHRLDTWLEHDWTVNGDGSSEQREVYKLYFRILHPEEEPAELRGEHIP